MMTHYFKVASTSITLIFIILQQQSSIINVAAQLDCINEENICQSWGFPYRPFPGCREYAECERGVIKTIRSCGAGTLFDVYVQSCNWDYDTFCNIETCAPTVKPTPAPTSDEPTFVPSAQPTVSPSASPSSSPSIGPTFNFFSTLETDTMRRAFQNSVLVAYNANGIKFPSARYTFDGMIVALKEMATGIQSDGREFRFYVGSEEANIQYGRTNLAVFLAMAMTESILYDTCDEYNEDQVAGKYAISNSCGQFGRSYQDEICTGSDVDMSCSVDTNMVIVSSSTSISQGGRPPPPLSCRPKEDFTDYAGYWDSRTGQASSNPYANTLGRIDTEGCCFWGRGVLLTRGVCNIGRLNYFLGKRAYDERGEGRFPTIDFCAYPEATCASDSSTETMRWITGLFDWIYRVQSYEAYGWSYMNALQKFVDNGFEDAEDEKYPFIDTVSSVFVRDCHDVKCSNLQITKKDARRLNFDKVMDIMKVTEKPTRQPTPRPTSYKAPTPLPSKKEIVIKPPPPVWTQPPPSASVTTSNSNPSSLAGNPLTPPSSSGNGMTANPNPNTLLTAPAPSPDDIFNPIVVNLTPPSKSPTINPTFPPTETPVQGLIILEDNSSSTNENGATWLLMISVMMLVMY